MFLFVLKHKGLVGPSFRGGGVLALWDFQRISCRTFNIRAFLEIDYAQAPPFLGVR